METIKPRNTRFIFVIRCCNETDVLPLDMTETKRRRRGKRGHCAKRGRRRRRRRRKRREGEEASRARQIEAQQEERADAGREPDTRRDTRTLAHCGKLPSCSSQRMSNTRPPRHELITETRGLVEHRPLYLYCIFHMITVYSHHGSKIEKKKEGKGRRILATFS